MSEFYVSKYATGKEVALNTLDRTYDGTIFTIIDIDPKHNLISIVLNEKREAKVVNPMIYGLRIRERFYG